MKKVVLLFFVSIVLFSCKKDSKIATTIDLGYGYFPRIVGSWIIYDVDSIVHDLNDDKAGIIDTFKYQIKEIIESESVDLEGRKTHRIERYKRVKSTDSWQINTVWYSTLTSERAEQSEENRTYVKFIFPPKKGKKFNGNAFNNEGEMTYEFDSIDEILELNSLVFDSVATVIQLDNKNVIEVMYEEEKYAKNVGMVFRERDFIDIQNEGGYEYSEIINSFGK